MRRVYGYPCPADVEEWAHLLEERIGILLDSGWSVEQAEREARVQVEALYRRARERAR